jgi:hypothetical protein
LGIDTMSQDSTAPRAPEVATAALGLRGEVLHERFL